MLAFTLPRDPRVNRVWMLLAVALLAAGCGGGGRRTVTLSGYGVYHATTVSASPSPAACAADARIVGRDAVLLVAHMGAEAAYPADLYYYDLRPVFADFQARSCDPALLGPPLRARLTPRQLAALVAYLPREMAAVIRKGLS